MHTSVRSHTANSCSKITDRLPQGTTLDDSGKILVTGKCLQYHKHVHTV